MRIVKILILLLAVSLLSFKLLNTGKISLKVESKTLKNGKAVIVKSEVYYKYNEGVMITNYTYPANYIYLSNKIGEAKIYYPDKNEVYLKTDKLFTTENSLLHIFFNNKIADMGLRDLGFKISKTDFEDGLVITTFTPPVELIDKVAKIKLVHENYMPIYASYFNKEDQITKKIYYYDYMNYKQFSLPLKVTEMNFDLKGDSTISKINFTDVKFDSEATSQYFNYSIPQDAKIIKE